MYNPQKLHPISYITGLIKVIKQNIFTFIVFIGFNIWNYDFTDIKHYIGPTIFFIIFLISFINQFLEVRVTRYWLEADQFIVTSGWINKKRKELNISRIQSLDTTQSLINQIVGGVSLQIKTPSDGIELATISKKQSDLLEQAIKLKQIELNNNDSIRESNAFKSEIEQEKTNTPVEKAKDLNAFNAENNQRLIFKMSFKTLLLMAMTSGAIGVAIATISPIIGAFQEVIPWNKWTSNLWHWVNSIIMIILILVIAVLLISYIIGTIITLIRYYNYTVIQQDNQLKITYGLFNVKNITVPTNRLQAVLEKQSFLRKLFGYTSIHFVITSDLNVESKEDASDNVKIMILPFIKRKEAYKIIGKLVPEMNFGEVNKGMPWRGYHRHFLIPSLIFVIIAGVATYFWSAWSFLIVGMLIIIMAVHALIYIKNSGIAMNNEEITVHSVGMFGFNTYFFKTNKIIGVETTQNPFLERSALANLQFIIAKGSVSEMINLYYMSEKKVDYYVNAYLRGDYNE